MARQEGKRERFLQDVERGAAFEKQEKSGWVQLKDGTAKFEKVVPYHDVDRKGRVDILIEELGDDMVSVVEVKATAWDRMKPHRVRPNVRRHVRQIWRYIDSFVDSGMDVCPGVIYPTAPNDSERRQLIEEMMGEEAIQVVWADERQAADTCTAGTGAPGRGGDSRCLQSIRADGRAVLRDRTRAGRAV